jgi:hypothetical protein
MPWREKMQTPSRCLDVLKTTFTRRTVQRKVKYVYYYLGDMHMHGKLQNLDSLCGTVLNS